MLPVAQIGSMLSQNQWTEELPHNAAEDSGKTDAFAKFNPTYLPPGSNSAFFSSFFSEIKALAYIHSSEQIPSNHSSEIVIPPPDSVI